MRGLSWSVGRSDSWGVVSLSASLNWTLRLLEAWVHVQAVGHAPRLCSTFIL